MDWVCFFIPALWQGANTHSNLFFPSLWDASEMISNIGSVGVSGIYQLSPVSGESGQRISSICRQQLMACAFITCEKAQ